MSVQTACFGVLEWRAADVLAMRAVRDQPARFYGASNRHYDGRLAGPVYSQEQACRHVGTNGDIEWPGGFVFIGDVLIGDPVAVSETDQGYMAVYYFGLLLGYIDNGARAIRSPERRHPTARG